MVGISWVRLFGTLMMLLLLTLICVQPIIAQVPSIVIDAVDDSAFPQVNVTVTVQGAAAQDAR